MAELILSLLGPFQATLDGEPLGGFRTNKVQALLVYLAAQEPVSFRREALMTLLWPGLPGSSARGNLRQIVYHLRRAIPEAPPKDAAEGEAVPFLLSGRQTVGINPAASFEVDLHRFNDLIEQVASHEHMDFLSCQACRQNLETAAALYRGDFLADFYLDDSNEFEEWAAAKRETQRRAALDALESLAQMFIRAKNYPQARAYAERQLQLDDLRESAYRQLMTIMALSGRRSEALALYESCRRLLADELGMAPAARTTELYEQLLAGDIDLSAGPAQTARGYDLREEIGAGAYGVVHRAYQPAVNREVAVKIIRAKYANNGEFIRRFEAEAQTVARLEHPFIVPLYDYWRDPAGAYLVMRLLRGGSLQSALEDGPWPPDRALAMLNQVAAALSIAHGRGIIHRDIKPANILLDEEGNCYLSDFGIAKDLVGGVQLTAAGAVIGTPDYISPEQIRNEDMSPQTDMYGLGVVLYETLTGEKPFPDASLATLIHKHLNEPLPLLAGRRPELSPEIDLVVQRATAKDPADRYSTAPAMAEAFQSAVSSELPVDGAGAPLAVSLASTIAATGELTNPYKGLRAFQETDAADFFGRRTLVEALINRLTASRFVAVVGPSGSGKSSVVKAGLIPALREGAIPGSERWFVAEMVPGAQPLEELAAALLPIAVDPPPSLAEPLLKDERGLLRTVQRVLPEEPGRQMLLFIDQFEELYTLAQDEQQRRHFIKSLLVAINEPGTPLRLIITLRADFYDRPLQDQLLGQLLKRHTELVLSLTQAELEQAVSGPAGRVGVTLEPALLAAITADVAEQPGALPLLQYMLTELFEQRQNNMLTAAVYHEIGGVTGALGRRAEELYRFFDAAGQAATRQLLLRLVTLGEETAAESTTYTRRRVMRAELEGMVSSGRWSVASDQPPATGDQQPATSDLLPMPNPGSPMPAVLDSFGRHRLLTFDHDPLTRAPTVEVAHEALLSEWPRLRGWLESSRDDVRLQRRLAVAAAEWTAAGQKPSFLLRGGRLDQFAGWLETSDLALTPEEQAFLEASLAERESRLAEEEARRQAELETAQKLAETEAARAEEQTRAAGRLRRRAVFLAGTLALAVLLAIAAFAFARQSSQNAVLAATRESEAVTDRQAADAQSRLAQSRELAAAAIANLNVDPELSIMLALQGLAVTRTLEAENSLHQAILVKPDELSLTGLDERVLTIAFSPDGRQVSAAGFDGSVLIWDVDSGEALQHLTGHSDVINAIAYSPDGTRLATASDDMTVRVWDPGTGQTLLTLTGYEEFVADVDYSPDGERLATAGADGQAKIWDAASGQELLQLQASSDLVRAIDFSPDGSLLATASDGGTVKLWDTSDGREVLTFSAHNDGTFDVIFSPDGTRLATEGDGVLKLWALDAPGTVDYGRLMFALPALAGGIDRPNINFLPDGSGVLGLASDNSVKVWDAETGQERLKVVCRSKNELVVALSPDGASVAVAGAVTGDTEIVKLCRLSASREVITFEGHTDRAYDVAFSNDGSVLYSASLDGTARAWTVPPPGESASGHQLLIFGLEGDQLLSVEPSPNGRLLATGGVDGVVKIWDSESGDLIRILSGHTGNIPSLAFSPNGAHLATAGVGIVKVWDVLTGEQVLNLAEHDSWLGHLAFSPDGRYLVTAGWADHVAKIWETSTGWEIYSIAHPGEVLAVDFSPDGKILATAGVGNMIHLWDFEKTVRLRLPTEIRRMVGHSGPIADIAFSPDGAYLASASYDNTVKVWDLATGLESLTLPGHQSTVWGVEFSPDGKRLASAGWDGTIRVYTLDLAELIAIAESRVTRSLTELECRQYLHLEACPE